MIIHYNYQLIWVDLWLQELCWLVGQYTHPSETYEFVNWDDEIPNMNGKIKNGNQTTNQYGLLCDLQL